MKGFPKSVNVRDDTMREGLQIEDKDIPVDEKLRLLDALGEMGLKTISIGSFDSSKLTPQMACIDEIAERFEPKPGWRRSNGYTLAIGCCLKTRKRGNLRTNSFCARRGDLRATC